MQTNDEILDLVNENDEVIDTKPRSEVYALGLTNFRVINLFLKNDKGELWIPRRTAHKRIFPLCLDISAAGHVESGEDYETALAREVMEELNIDIASHPVTFLGKATPHEHGVSAFEQVYELKYDEVPPYNPHDYCEWMWITPQGLLKRFDAGEPAKSDLPKLVRLFYSLPISQNAL